MCFKGNVALFVFNEDAMYFVHAMLNALDMSKKGYDVKMVMEGNATKLVKDFFGSDHPFSNLYQQVKEEKLIDCVCKACSTKMGSLKSAEEQGLFLCDELMGHPSMARYMENGYQILIF
jgi:hypothetical protein